MTTFRELGRRAEDLAGPTVDVDALISRGEQQLRRRRVAAVASAVGLVLVMIVGGVFVGRADPEGSGPIDRPERHDQAPASPRREIVYADGASGRVIHFGDRVVTTGITYAQIDVTDDGFVYGEGFLRNSDSYLKHGRLWFSDGDSPQEIGSRSCGSPHGSPEGVVVGNAGSLVAWLACTAAGPQDLVVFDTSSMREVVRERLTDCSGHHASCVLEAVIGAHVYFTRATYPHGNVHVTTEQWVMFDVTTGTSKVSSQESYEQDVASHSRGLVVGDSWDSGTPTDGISQHFDVVGSELVPQIRLSNGDLVHAAAFDTATGAELGLHLPSGYDGAPGFTLFEWLDDDTVALVAAGDRWPDWAGLRGYGDILTCRLSDGRCELALEGRGDDEGDPVRIVPHLGLPG